MPIDQQQIRNIIMALWQAEELWLEVTAFPDKLKAEPKRLLLHLANLIDSNYVILGKSAMGNDQVRLTALGHTFAESLFVEKQREDAMLDLAKTLREPVVDETREIRYESLTDINVKFR